MNCTICIPDHTSGKASAWPSCKGISQASAEGLVGKEGRKEDLLIPGSQQG